MDYSEVIKTVILVTGGGLSEKIDNVRSIKNKSTGELAKVISEKLVKEFYRDVYFLHTEDIICPPNVKSIKINDILHLKAELNELLKTKPIKAVVHAMAVSDYHVEGIYKNGEIIPIKSKLDSSEERVLLSLKRNPKIISMIKKFNPRVKLIGFKLTDGKTEEEQIKIAINQIEKNNCDYVLVNDIFGIFNTKSEQLHKAMLINKNGEIVDKFNTKEEIANKICEVTI